MGGYSHALFQIRNGAEKVHGSKKKRASYSSASRAESKAALSLSTALSLADMNRATSLGRMYCFAKACIIKNTFPVYAHVCVLLLWCWSFLWVVVFQKL